MIRTFKIYSLSNFQICNVVLLAIVTMLYMTSQGLIYLQLEACTFFFFLKACFSFFFLIFIYLWLCWVFVSVRGLSLVVASGGHPSSRCAGLSLLRPLLLRSAGSRRAGSVIVAHGPSRSAACGILPDQGSNPCPLHWQADSQPLRHQGSLRLVPFDHLHPSGLPLTPCFILQHIQITNHYVVHLELI